MNEAAILTFASIWQYSETHYLFANSRQFNFANWHFLLVTLGTVYGDRLLRIETTLDQQYFRPNSFPFTKKSPARLLTQTYAISSCFLLLASF